ncbi:MAG: hypothetical protein KDK70_25925 [Myxococcales bacterium]|nr:hypothetical protein [Myxococcales bacterium]
MKITTTIAGSALWALCLLMAPACDSAKKDAKPEGEAAAKAGAAEAKAGEAEAKTGEAEAKAGEADAEAKAGEAEAKAVEGLEPSGDPLPTIGVTECDDYITQMSKCFEGDAIPAESRDAQKMGFEMSVKSWADSAKANADSTSTLVPACKAAMDAARKMYPGCFAAP